MSGFTPGTADYNAAVAYYTDQHYQGPSLLALHGLSYYTNSPAVQWFLATDAAFGYRVALNTYGEDPDGVTIVVDSKLNPLHDPNMSIPVELRDGEWLEWIPGDENNAGVWHLRGPAEQNITRGLNWSDVRAGIEYVGTVIGLAIVGGELLTPAADVAPEALGIGTDIGIDVAANTTTGLIGTTTEIAPTVAGIAPTIADIAPTVADIAPAVTDIAPTVADIAPAVTVADAAAPSLTELASDVKTVVGTVTTVEKFLNPTQPKPIQNVNQPPVQVPSVHVPSPSPDESGEIPVVALLGFLLFKVF